MFEVRSLRFEVKPLKTSNIKKQTKILAKSRAKNKQR